MFQNNETCNEEKFLTSFIVLQKILPVTEDSSVPTHCLVCKAKLSASTRATVSVFANEVSIYIIFFFLCMYVCMCEILICSCNK